MVTADNLKEKQKNNRRTIKSLGGTLMGTADEKEQFSLRVRGSGPGSSGAEDNNQASGSKSPHRAVSV